MLGTLVVGLGRAGSGLHLKVLRRLRPHAPLVGYDPYVDHREWTRSGLVLADSLADAAVLLDPADTVVHLCTPPTARIGPLTELAQLGFRRVLVEKPLASDEVDLRELLALRDAAGLDLLPVGQWRSSALTSRIAATLRVNPARSITIAQHKPRFQRADNGHATAFDVEIPHSVLVALLLAGPAEVADASCTDLVLGDATYPGLAGAHLRLAHHSGIVTDIRTDLTSPVRERRITVETNLATLVGHYAVSDADDHAQLWTGRRRSVFRDDSLGAFLDHAYRHFAGVDRLTDEPETGAAVVELIAAAKRLAGCAPVGAAR